MISLPDPAAAVFAALSPGAGVFSPAAASVGVVAKSFGIWIASEDSFGLGALLGAAAALFGAA